MEPNEERPLSFDMLQFVREVFMAHCPNDGRVTPVRFFEQLIVCARRLQEEVDKTSAAYLSQVNASLIDQETEASSTTRKPFARRKRSDQ